jgi:hypothetical protein
VRVPPELRAEALALLERAESVTLQQRQRSHQEKVRRSETLL